MKIILITILSGVIFYLNKSYSQVESGAKIEFEKELHDYGNLEYRANGTCTFEFKNTGDAPLIILEVKSSCGCVVASGPREPIASGKKGKIIVNYDTKRKGPFLKTVTVTSNAINEPTKVIRIKGTVGPAPENNTPVNNSGPGSDK